MDFGTFGARTHNTKKLNYNHIWKRLAGLVVWFFFSNKGSMYFRAIMQDKVPSTE